MSNVRDLIDLLMLWERIASNNETTFYNINQKLNTVMATQEQVKAILAKIDAATTKAGEGVTAIGDKIEALKNSVTDMGLTKDQEDEIVNQIGDIATRTEKLADALTEMGKSESNPVPIPVPDVPTEPEPTPTPTPEPPAEPTEPTPVEPTEPTPPTPSPEQPIP